MLQLGDVAATQDLKYLPHAQVNLKNKNKMVNSLRSVPSWAVQFTKNLHPIQKEIGGFCALILQLIDGVLDIGILI